MPNPYDVLNSSSSSSDEASKDDTFSEDAGSAVTSLTEANLGVLAPTNGSRRRDDDEESLASTFTHVSCFPSRHAARRVQERNISEGDIKQAKASGNVSLAVRFKDEDKEQAEAEIIFWGGLLVASFDSLVAGKVGERGEFADRRLQAELHGSAGQGRRIKAWLKDKGYFDHPLHRVIFTLQRENEELMVVEGLLEENVVIGIITAYLRYDMVVNLPSIIIYTSQHIYAMTMVVNFPSSIFAHSTLLFKCTTVAFLG